MWDEQKSLRFQELRARDSAGLSGSESNELAALIRDLEAAEAKYLAPATQKIHREREKIESQASNLKDLVQRKEARVRRLRDFLVEAENEHRGNRS